MKIKKAVEQLAEQVRDRAIEEDWPFLEFYAFTFFRLAVSHALGDHWHTALRKRVGTPVMANPENLLTGEEWSETLVLLDKMQIEGYPLVSKMLWQENVWRDIRPPFKVWYPDAGSMGKSGWPDVSKYVDSGLIFHKLVGSHWLYEHTGTECTVAGVFVDRFGYPVLAKRNPYCQPRGLDTLGVWRDAKFCIELVVPISERKTKDEERNPYTGQRREIPQPAKPKKPEAVQLSLF